MKPIPDIILQSYPGPLGMIMARPWWMETTGGWIRRDGLFSDRLRSETIEDLDARQPLPHPGFRVGQAWAWEDKDYGLMVLQIGAQMHTPDLFSYLPLLGMAHPRLVTRMTLKQLLADAFLVADPACPHLAPWGACMNDLNDPGSSYTEHVKTCSACKVLAPMICEEAKAIHNAMSLKERADMAVEDIERDMQERYRGYTMDSDTFEPRWLTAREAALIMVGGVVDGLRWRDDGLHLLQVCIHPDAPHEVKLAEYYVMLHDWADGGTPLYLFHGEERISVEQAVRLLSSTWCRWLTLAPPPWRALEKDEDPDEAMAAMRRQLDRQRQSGLTVIFYTAEDGDLTPDTIAAVIAKKNTEHRGALNVHDA